MKLFPDRETITSGQTEASVVYRPLTLRETLISTTGEVVWTEKTTV
ncbi:hypothetical protein H1Y23_004916 [Salmonella enterica]|nr:hypothetical protein [Salmonella enterica]EGA4729243.1 hypothetical protein [Salmonella enterica]